MVEPRIIPSATELSLLKALWKHAPMTVRALHLEVQDEMEWSFSSTRKTLERMLGKGLVLQATAQGVNVYSPAVEKVDTLAAFARDFSQRVMEMDTPLTAAMFTGSKLVDQQELARLDELLNNWPVDES